MCEYLLSLHPVKKQAFILLTSLVLLAGCQNAYQKVLKSDDIDYKYSKALEYYNNKSYFKAIPIFEELMRTMKGTKSMEEVYFYYCMSQFKQKNYLLSGFHFKEYFQSYPYSDKAEEALFMYAESYEKQSPRFTLEQTNTYKAIDAYQTFINSYSYSNRVDYCNEKIDALRAKLEKKALFDADLYYRTKNYRAAAISYRNLLIDYPDIDNAEGIQYKIVNAFYKYAEQSIATKQVERYEDVISSGKDFVSRYPASEYVPEVQSTIELTHYDVINASLQHAKYLPLDERLEQLERAQDVYEIHFPYLKDGKLTSDANHALEETFFNVIRTNYLLAQESEKEKRTDYFKKTVQAYFDFNQKYSNSKFSNEAEKIFTICSRNLKKLQSNG